MPNTHLVSVRELPVKCCGKRPGLQHQIDSVYLPLHLFAQRHCESSAACRWPGQRLPKTAAVHACCRRATQHLDEAAEPRVKKICHAAIEAALRKAINGTKETGASLWRVYLAACLNSTQCPLHPFGLTLWRALQKPSTLTLNSAPSEPDRLSGWVKVYAREAHFFGFWMVCVCLHVRDPIIKRVNPCDLYCYQQWRMDGYLENI